MKVYVKIALLCLNFTCIFALAACKGTDEKNYTLIRNDILQNMRNLYDHYNEESIKQTALDLIETVDDQKYKKKYLGIWK